MTSRHYLHTGQRTCHAEDGQEVPCAGWFSSFRSIRDESVLPNRRTPR